MIKQTVALQENKHRTQINAKRNDTSSADVNKTKHRRRAFV
jgi:hypothetical protein